MCRRTRFNSRLKSLEALPPTDRTLATGLELARGHVELALVEVAALEAQLGEKIDPVALTRLRRLAEDDAVAPAVLAAFAQHPSADGADFLYEVAVDPHAADAVRYLAGDLLALPAVRGAATKALLVTLDLAPRDGAWYLVEPRIVHAIDSKPFRVSPWKHLRQGLYAVVVAIAGAPALAIRVACLRFAATRALPLRVAAEPLAGFRAPGGRLALADVRLRKPRPVSSPQGRAAGRRAGGADARR